MTLHSTITNIQKQIKTILGISSTPDIASSKSIKFVAENLAIGLESMTKDEKSEIVNHIVTEYKRTQNSMTIHQDKSEDQTKLSARVGMIDFTGNVAPDTQATPPESSALTFNSGFEKAALVKTELTQVGIQVKDVQALNIAESMKDSFASKNLFLLTALELYQQKFNENSQLVLGAITEKLNDIRNSEMSSNAEVMTLLHTHAVTMQDYRNSYDEQFKSMVSQVLGVDCETIENKMLNGR